MKETPKVLEPGVRAPHSPVNMETYRPALRRVASVDLGDGMRSLNERVSTGATAIRDEKWSQRNGCFRIYQLSIMEASGGTGLRSGPIPMDLRK